MPYIHPRCRGPIDDGFLEPQTAGELNYAITQLVIRFLYAGRRLAPSYTDFNDAIGALECAKLELYRRKIAPYEDTKMIENGDVYP